MCHLDSKFHSSRAAFFLPGIFVFHVSSDVKSRVIRLSFFYTVQRFPCFMAFKPRHLFIPVPPLCYMKGLSPMDSSGTHHAPPAVGSRPLYYTNSQVLSCGSQNFPAQKSPGDRVKMLPWFSIFKLACQ